MKKVLLTSIALGAVLALSGVARADIKVGVAGPLTGPNAAFGAQLQKGAEQAAADINAAGGINGEKIVLEFGDDVGEVAAADRREDAQPDGEHDQQQEAGIIALLLREAVLCPVARLRRRNATVRISVRKSTKMHLIGTIRNAKT